MNETLKAKGWIMYWSCSVCTGGSKEHWRNEKYPHYEIVTRARKQTFKIFSNNHVICGPEWGYKLTTKMKEHGIDA
jgi:hypothetical protein